MRAKPEANIVLYNAVVEHTCLRDGIQAHGEISEAGLRDLRLRERVIKEVPVVRNGRVVPGKRMAVTLSCDHRAVDGATGARFLEALRSFMEKPVRLAL